MIKKLAKYGKIVIAATLIMALALPSYATVGASDGSAFVTKAEFDAALSDFNARLTTFEAGINSKIDSQVSSYLDRNGIWNGKDQSLLYSTALKVYVDGSGGEMTGFWSGFKREDSTHAQLITTYSGGPQVCYKMNARKSGDGQNLWKVNKSGLMRIDCSVRNRCYNGGTCNAFIFQNTSQTFYTHGCYMGHIMLKIGASVVAHIVGVEKEWNTLGDGGLNPYDVSYNTSVFFFIAKGDIVTSSLISKTQEDTGGLPGLWGASQIPCELTVSFNQAKVY